AAGARGLRQPRPGTALPLAPTKSARGDHLDDPEQNLQLGTRFLAGLLREFGDPRVALAAYNAGPKRVRQWWSARRTNDVEAWVELIPYDETRYFVKRVRLSWDEYGWLAALGHEVHLVDALAQHVEYARRTSARQPDHPIASARVGDARRLDEADASVDAVLLLGPLYHLPERPDRLAALVEARRVLKPGGLVFAAGISRFASLFAGVFEGLLRDPAFVAIVERDLHDGRHANPTERDYFTTAYFHLPHELEAEVREAGFVTLDLVGVEGPGWLLSDLEARWADPVERERL